MPNDSLARVKRATASCLAVGAAVAAPMAAQGEATLTGSMIANGQTIELPYVYVWAEEEGFYDSSDPTWRVLFVEKELKQRDLGGTIWDAAWIEIGVTETKEFDDAPVLQVYSQSIKFAADAGGNVSGGDYPQIEMTGMDTGHITGRIWHPEQQEIFDDTFQFDFTFTAPLSDPDAPIGDVLPDGGGEPGLAYLEWVETVHSGDLQRFKSIVPAETAAQLEQVSAEEAAEEIAFMRSMTPTDVHILTGSSDGETAVLKIEGVIEGDTIAAEVTMTKMGDFWIPTGFSI